MIALRNTVQRKIILDVVQKMHSHPTAEEVYQEVHKEHPSISKATVYRNLHQLAGEGTVSSLLIQGSPERFDDRLSRHYHFRCKVCGSVFDVDMDYISGINDAVQRAYGFQVDEHDVLFKGICPKCKQVKAIP